jgi:hypothetical protein
MNNEEITEAKNAAHDWSDHDLLFAILETLQRIDKRLQPPKVIPSPDEKGAFTIHPEEGDELVLMRCPYI